MKKELRFPTFIGLIFLIASIFAGVYLSGSTKIFNTKASGDCAPTNLQITNLTHTSASVSFTTSATCQANLEINNQTIQDLKSETSNTPDLSTRIHYFDIRRLSEKTLYDFSIISGGTVYNDTEFKFTTGSTPTSTLPTSNLAWGKILAGDGKSPGNGLVYLNIPGAYPLSSIITSNGNWSISLANTFNESKNNWFTLPAETINEDIIVIAEDGTTTQIVNTSNRNNPVPDIIIGKNSLDPPSPGENQNIDTGQIGSQQQVSSSKKIDITNPKNGDMINVTRPDFFGSAPQNSKVIIEVHSPTLISGEATSDSAGTWHWSPPQNLEPGEHTITVKTQDPATGIWESITRSFTVLAADTNTGPNFEASGSAITPTVVPTIVPTTIPTAAPTSVEPTIIPTIIPTIFITDVPVPTERATFPSTTIKPPVTANTIPTTMIIIFSCIFLLISFKLLQ